MDVKVDQLCPSCNNNIHCEGELERITGTGLMREITANWECPECGVEYDHEHPFDETLMTQSGFHSWVGSIEGESACIVVSDGGEYVDEKERE